MPGGEETGRRLIAEHHRAVIIGQHDTLRDHVECPHQLLLGRTDPRSLLEMGLSTARSSATIASSTTARTAAGGAATGEARGQRVQPRAERTPIPKHAQPTLPRFRHERSMWSATGAQSADVIPLMIVTAAYPALTSAVVGVGWKLDTGSLQRHLQSLIAHVDQRRLHRPERRGLGPANAAERGERHDRARSG